MLEPTGKLVHALSAEYRYVIAPFAANVSAAETGWWASLLRQTPSVDIVALQDGVGVTAGCGARVAGQCGEGKRSPEQASQLIKAVSAAVKGAGMQMWADIEVFSHPDCESGATQNAAQLSESVSRAFVCCRFVVLLYAMTANCTNDIST